MSKVVITYWPLRGLGEQLKLICEQGRAVATGGALGAAAPHQFALPSGPMNYIDTLKKNNIDN